MPVAPMVEAPPDAPTLLPSASALAEPLALAGCRIVQSGRGVVLRRLGLVLDFVAGAVGGLFGAARGIGPRRSPEPSTVLLAEPVARPLMPVVVVVGTPFRPPMPAMPPTDTAYGRRSGRRRPTPPPRTCAEAGVTIKAAPLKSATANAVRMERFMDVSFGDVPGGASLCERGKTTNGARIFSPRPSGNLTILNAILCESVRTGANCGASAARIGKRSDCGLNR